MNLLDLQNKNIGIAGFGIEGQAVAAYLKAHGIQFRVYDRNKDLPGSGLYDPALFSADRGFFGPDYLKHIEVCDVIFRSPGLPINQKELLDAADRGTAITSQIKFFFENCGARIIGVTGTKGKGTTSSLIYEILRSAGLKARLAGNIGQPAISFLDNLNSNEWVVLELSSFQLQDLETSPHIAVVLMTTSEHLNYHASEEEYWLAKSSITKFQKPSDFAVINQDFANSMKIGALGQAQKFYVQSTGDLNIQSGCYVDSVSRDIYWIEQAGRKEFLFNAQNILLPGLHMLQNVAAAVAVAKIIQTEETQRSGKLPFEDDLIIQTIKEFPGLEHRLEFAGEKNSVKFYDDSIGTTPESCVAAADAFNQPKIMIIGGFDKGADYEMLARHLSARSDIHAVILIGHIADRLKRGFESAGFEGKIDIGAQNMSEIFERLKLLARPGDVVVLAPATSSFGMFKNYQDRGDQFKQAVRDL